jgi:hypothetical protein
VSTPFGHLHVGPTVFRHRNEGINGKRTLAEDIFVQQASDCIRDLGVHTIRSLKPGSYGD